MAELTLYTNALSPNGRRVELFLKYAQIPYRAQVVDLRKGEQRLPDFLAKNPHGKIPTIQDGNAFLWESHAILRYLAGSRNLTQFYPSEAVARARVDGWMDWNLGAFGAAVRKVVVATLFRPDPAVAQEGKEEVKPLLSLLDQNLQKNRFIAGDTLTIADFSVATALGRLEDCGVDLKAYPAVHRWFEPIKGWPGWKETNPPRI